MVLLSCRHLTYLIVGVAVSSVHIADDVWLYQDMVESGVEDGLLLVRTVDIYPAQFSFPGIVCGAYVVVEVPALCLCRHVVSCSLAVDGRDGHLHHERLVCIIAELEHSFQRPSVHYVHVVQQSLAVHHHPAGEGL